MNRQTLLFLVFGGLIGFCLEAQAQQERQQLRILCYNVHHGEGIDNRLDLERIANIISHQNPDLVALQEIDSKTSRTNRTDQARVLANFTDMHFAFGPNIEFGGGKYGNAILSKHPILSSENKRLPNIGSGEQRGLLKVVIKPAGFKQPVHFYSTHFDHRKQDTERIASAEFVNQQIDTTGNQLVFLAGDFNCTIGSQPMNILEEKWNRSNGTELPTIPVDNPQRQIDFIFTPKAQKTTCLKTEVLPEAIASDHRAVFAIFSVE